MSAAQKSPASFVDRKQVARRFARVASTYPEADFFAREIDRRMLERLDLVSLQPHRIVDLGCSRGASLQQLAQRYPAASLYGLDLVPAMLQAAQPSAAGWRRWLGRPSRPFLPVAADAAHLPIKSQSTAMVWSNLLLHWLDDPIPALAEAHRVLEVGGLLMFSTLGPDTLHELRASFGDTQAHTQRFADMHDLGDMLVGCGFADPVVDMEVLTLTYADLPSLLAELRAAGSGCAMQARSRGLLGRQAYQRLCAAYEARRQDGRLPATFEVIYGHAWKAAPTSLPDGRAIVRFDRPGKGRSAS